ncbi:unnamed protein product, partial [Callosobruchus maculatus]
FFQVIGGENDDGKTQYTSGSPIRSSTLKPTREANSNENSVFGSPVDYSNVHFDSNVRFASTIQGPEYLPPLEGTTPSISTYQPSIPTTPRPVSCPPGTQRTIGGLCERTQLPECPPGTIRKPDNSCEKPACPYGYEQQPDGSCKRLQPPTTPQTPTTPSCPPGTYSIGGGRCSSPSSPVSSCPPGTLRRPDGSCGPRTGPTPTPCPPGTHLTALGECAPDTQKSVCPFGAVRLPDGTCQTSSSPRPCPPGTFLTASGTCGPSSTPTTPTPSCPPGTIQQPDGSCQRRITPLPTCPPGTFRGPSGECRTQPTPLPGCPIGSTRQPDGSCQRSCPPGSYPQPNGECRGPSTPSPTPKCPAGTIQQPDGSCQRPSSPSPSCPPGSYPGPNGECRGPSTPTSRCPAGTIQQADGSCQRPSSPAPSCPPGSYPGPSGECRGPSTPTPRCPAGTIQQPDGSCQRPSSPAPSCPPGSYPGPNGECRGPSTPTPRCPAGTIQQPDGSCQRPSSPAPSCPPGSYPGPNGECRGPSTPTSRCPAGTFQQPDGSCQRPSSPAPSCPPGSYPGPNGECRGPSTPTSRCPAGTIQQPDGSCQRPSSPALSCPPGSYPGPNGECRGPSTPSPTPRCPAGTIPQPDGSCQRPQLPCPPGFYQGHNGECKRRTTPAPRCPIGTVQQPDGSCQKPKIPAPACPVGTTQQPDGSCQRPIRPTSCPPNTYLGPSGSCEPVRGITTTSPPAYEYPKPCPPGTVKTASGTCEALPSSPRPACPTGTRSTPFGTCEPIFSATTPKPPPRPFERPTTPELNKDYLPPKPTTQYVPSITTHRPHQTSTTTEHRTSFTSPTQHQPFSTPRPFTAITKPSCSQGQILSSNGVCIYPQTPANTPATRPCPPGTKISPFTNECVKSPSGFTTGYEYPKPTTPTRPTPSSRPQCGIGQVLSPSGICVQPTKPTCKPGEILSSSGECVYQKTPELSTPKPSCPTGQVPAASGFGCEYPRVTTSSCPPGTKLNSFTNQCDKTPEAKPPLGPTSSKPCPSGQVPSSSGFGCEYPRTPAPSCPPGKKLSPFTKECVPSTTTGYEYQKPTTATYRPTYGPSTSRPPCPQGQVPSRSGSGCEFPRGPAPAPSCPPGTSLSSFSNKCEKTTGVTSGYEYPKPSTPFSETPRPTVSPGPQCGPGQTLSPSGQCVSPSRPGSPMTGPSTPKPCPPGQVPSASGYGCEYPRLSTPPPTCPPGTNQNRFTKQCEKTPEASTGYEYPRPTVPSKPPCSPGETLSPSGNCIPSKPYGQSTTLKPACRFGQVLSTSGECVYQESSTARPPFGPTTAKSCPSGQVPSSSGFGCEYPRTPVPSCPPGTKLSPFTKECVPSTTTGYEYQKPTTATYRPTYGPSTSRPPCPQGQVPSRSGSGCEFPRGPAPAPSCPPGTSLSSFSNKCEKTTGVTSGYEYPKPSTPFSETPRPTVSPSPQCGPGQTLSPSGQCVSPSRPGSPMTGPSTPKPCPPGQVPSASGYGCEYPRVSTPPPTCPPGTNLNRFTKQCDTTPEASTGYEYPRPTVPSKPRCSLGETLSPSGNCIPSKPYGQSTTPKPACRFGQVLSASGECVYQESSTARPPFGPTTAKSCPSGQVPSSSGFGCEYPRTPAPSCPPGTKLSPFTKECVPSTTTGYEYQKPTTATYRPTYGSSTSKPPCPQGQVPKLSGGCEYPRGPAPAQACPPGTSLSSFSNKCEKTTSVTTGYEYPKPSTAFTEGPRPTIPARPQCGHGQSLSPSGQCISPSRPGPTTPGASTPKPCPQGQVPSASGYGCEYPKVSTTPPTCPPGTKLNIFSKQCEKTPEAPTGYEYPRPTVPSKPQCSPGETLSPSGNCIPSKPYGQSTTPKPACRFGQVLSATGECVYPASSTVRPPFGPTTAKPCPSGQVPSTSGFGCEYPRTPVPSCPPGTKLSPFTKECVPSTTTGYEYQKPTTATYRPTYGSFTSRPPCPQGQVPKLSGSGCEYPRGPAPTQACPPGTSLSSFSNKCEKTTSVTTGYEYPKPSTAFTEGPHPTIPARPRCGPGQSLSPSGQCIFPSRPGPATPGASTPKPCPQGQVPSASGYGCEYPKVSTPPPTCPPGTNLNRFTKQCEKSPEASTGYEYPRPTVPSKPQCSSGETLSPSGNCIPTKPHGPSTTPKPACRFGQVLSASGECVYPASSTVRPPFGPTTAKPCPSGQVPSTSGFGCEYPRTPVPSCPPGTKLSPFTKECVPSTTTGYEYQKPTTATYRPTYGPSTSRPPCPQGQVPSRLGSGCEFPRGPAPQSCPPGTRLSSSTNKCEKTTGVTSGYEYPKPSTPFSETPRPTVSPSPQCAPGQSLSPSGRCVSPSRPGSPTTGPSTPKPCPPGQVPSASGYGCEYPRLSTPPPTCPPGTNLNRFTKQCEKTPKASTGYEYPRPTVPSKPPCSPGETLSPSGNCIPPKPYGQSTTLKPACRFGQVLSTSGECVYQESSTARPPFGPTTAKSCPSGQVPSSSGFGCEYPRTPVLSCPPGTKLSPFTKECVPSTTTGYEYQKPTTATYRPTYGPSTSRPPCPQGQVPSRSGSGCEYPRGPAPAQACPPGTSLSSFSNKCEKTTSVTTGYEYPKPSTAFTEGPRPTIPARPQCGHGQSLSPSGQCISPSRPGPTTPGASTPKPCPQGQVPSASGYGCEYPRVSTPPPTCPPGTNLNRFTTQCEKSPEASTGYEYPRPTVPSKPQCSSGETLSPSGNCIPTKPYGPSTTPKPACRFGQVLSASGECVYPASSTARPPFGPTTAKPCPSGQVPSSSGFGCEYPRTPAPSCPPGTKLSPFTKECVPSTTTGYEYQKPTTATYRPTYGPSTSRPPCPQGQVPSRSGSGCEYPRGPAPVQACPPGASLSSFSNKCEKTVSVTTGYEYPRPSTAFTEGPRPTVSTRPQCGPGQSLSPSGQCVFPSRPGPTTSGASTPKPCPQGQVPSASGYGCEYPKVSTPPPTCPPGTKLNTFSKQCEKTPEASTGYEYPRPTVPSKPQCSPVETLSPSGNCIPSKPYGQSTTPKPACRFGQVLSATGECVYPASSTVRPPFGPTAKPCPSGQVPSTSGFGCEYPRTPIPSCPPGTKLSPFTKECVPSTTTGYEYQKPTTATYRPTYGSSTSRPPCPKGQVPKLSGSGCEYPRGPAPAQACPPGTSLSSFSNKCEKTTSVTTGYEYPKPSTAFTEGPRPTIPARPQCGPGQSLSPSGQCIFPSRPGPATPGASTPKPCPQGQVPSASGYGCEYPKVSTPPPTCPPGTNLNRFTKQCEKSPEASTGYEYPRPTVPSKPQCSSGETLSPSGNCIPTKPHGPSTTAKPACRIGQVLSASGECVYPASSTARPPFGPTTAKPCPSGQVPSASGFGCEYPRTPVPSCPPGTKPSPFIKECVPSTTTGYEYQKPTTATYRPTYGPSTSRPPCPQGQVPSRSGSGCEYPRGPAPAQACPPGTSLSSFSNKCEKTTSVTTGYEYPKPSTAFTEGPRPTIPARPQCGPGQSLSPSGQCVFPSRPGPTTPGASTPKPCPQGQVPSASGYGCEYPKVSTPPPTCPPGTKLNTFSKQCEKTPEASTGYEYSRPTTPSKPQCGPGETLSPSGNCISTKPYVPSTTAKPACRFGQVLSATGECVYPASSTVRPPFGPTTAKSCPSGQVPSASGFGCEYPRTPVPSCPPGTKLSPFTKECVPSTTTGYEYQKPTTATYRPTYGSSTSRPPCPQGQVPSRSGSGCEYPRGPAPAQACPPGTSLSSFSNKCEKTTSVTTGYEYSKPSTAFTEGPRPTIPARPQCGPGQSLSPSGQCIFPSRPGPTTPGASTPKPCPQGQVPSASGYGCEYPRVSTPPPTCPPGTNLNRFTRQCEKSPEASTGYEYPKPTVPSKPQCSSGETLSPSGNCIPTKPYGPSTTPKPACRFGQVLSASGECVYPASSTARPPFGPTTAKPCPSGQVPSSSGFGCEYPRTPAPSCPPGTKLSPFTKECVPSTTTGYEYQKPTTATYRPTYGPSTSRPPCPQGQVPSRSGSGCEYPRGPAPAQACPPGTSLSSFSNKCEKTTSVTTGYEYPRPSTSFTEGPRPTVSTRPQCGPGQSLSPSGQCVFPSRPGPTTPGASTPKPCPQGQVPSASGYGCQYPKVSTPPPTCPPGAKLNTFSKQCEKTPEASTGYEYPRPTTPSKPQCGPGETLSPSGNCIPTKPYGPSTTPKPACRFGQVLSASGECVYASSSTARPPFGPTTAKPCPPGQVPSASEGGCVYPRGPVPSQSCPPGTRFSSLSNKCEKTPEATPGYEYPKPTTAFPERPGTTVSPRPQCGPGQSLSPSGQCVFPSRPVSPTRGPTTQKPCPQGQVPSASGYGCEYPKVPTPSPTCPPGTRLNQFTKQCDRIAEATTGYEYPRPTTPSKPPKCSAGETLSPSGNCVPTKSYSPSSTPKPSCRFGQVLSASGECVYPASSTPRPPFGPTTAKPCPSGQVPSTSGFGCEYPRTPVPSCPPGTKLSPFTKECIPSTPTGYEYQTPTTATAERPKPTVTPGAQCGPGKTLSPRGQCVTVCRNGQVLTASGDCVYQTAVTTRPTFGPSTSRPSCPPGQVPSRSGTGCEYPEGPAIAQSCPPGTNFSYVSNKCEKTSGVSTGYEYPKPSTPFTERPRPAVSPRPQCGPGQSLSPSGQCIFPSRPGSPAIVPTTPSKPCPPGQVPSVSGYGCEFPKVSTPSPTCPPGTKLNLSTNQCEKTPQASPGYEYPGPSTPSQPQCGIGEILSPTGVCSPIKPYGPSSTSKPSCRPGQVLSPTGECIYPAGSTPSPPFGPTTKPCPPGQVPSTSGFGCEYPRTPVQSCPPGTKPSSSSGKCISISVSTPRPSTAVFEYQKPTTVSFERPQSTFVAQCKPGESLSPSGQCVTPSGGKFTTSSTPTGYQYPKPTTPFPEIGRPTSRPRCGQGQVLSPSGRCISSSIEPFRPQASSTVKPVCGPGQIVSDTGICAYPAKPSFGPSTPRVCPTGQVPSGSGCEYPSRPTTYRPSVLTGYEYHRPSTSYSPIRPTSKPQCAPGESLSPTGQCVAPSTSRPSYGVSTPKSCPLGQIPSASGIGCEYPRELVPTTFRPTGYEYKKPTTILPEYPQSTTRPVCGPGESLSPSGQCITPSGLRRPSYGSSTLKSCPPGQIPTTSGSGCEYPRGVASSTPGSTFESSTPKSCPPGQVLSASGFDCEYPKPPKPTTYRPSISTGYDYKRPTTPFPERSRPTSRPQCAPGESLSPSGLCVTPSGVTSRPTCGPGQVLTPSGDCVSRQTASRPTFGPSTPTPCPPGQIPSTSGFGYEYPKRGRPSTYFPGSTTPVPERQQPTITSSTPTSRPCPPGQVPSSSGVGCEYPKVPGPTTYRPRISTGYQYPKPTQPFQEPLKPTPSSRCGPGQILSASGLCIYPSGPSGCSPGQTLSPSGECVDKTITTYKPSFGIPTTKPSCPPGQVPSTSGVGCEYPKGPTTCRPGQILSSSGECIDRSISTYKPSIGPSTSKPSCPPGQVLSLSGVGCEYPRGVTPSRPLACKPGQTLSPSGVCLDQTISTYKPSFVSSCPPGQVPSASGVGCEYPQGPSQGCPPGQILSSSGSCIPVSQKPCPPGQTRSRSGICVQTTLHPHTVNHFTTTSPKARPTARPNGGYNYETPTPTFGYPSSPLDSSQNNIYGQYASTTSTPRYTPLKPGPSEGPDNTVDSANANSFFVPTTRQPVTGPQPSYSRQPTFNGGQQPIEETSPPVGCAAALKCVQEIYCTADGFVSPVPVVLTKEQELLRVPTTTCKDIETGIIGKCCRDPNYKDPWPSANLVNGVDDGQYKEDNFYGQRELASNRLTRASNLTGSPVIPPALRRSRTQEASNSRCGTRNQDSSPKGESPLDANFAEYPWQAMILRDSNRSLLCGGVIIRDNAILTSAHCVEGLDTNDVLAKGGEWKLGIDEEPLPFQIVKVGAIIRHPEYKPGSYHNDVAILYLREKLRFTKNIGPLCLSQTKEISPNSKCKLTGWGKRILQLHARGAIMHHIDVNVLDNQKCQEQLSDRFKESLPNYSPNMICGQSNIDHCKVDYGSALACENDQGQYEFAGIYTWDTGCNQEGQIAGFVKPDTDWIQTTLRKPIKELKRIEREYLRSH